MHFKTNEQQLIEISSISQCRGTAITMIYIFIINKIKSKENI